MKFVPVAITRAAASAVLKSKKNSPHIFFALGAAGIVGSTVLACKATLKLEKTIEDIDTEIKLVKEQGPYRDEREYQKAMGGVYARGAFELGKLYGPAIVVGGLSIAALTGSHVQLARRNTAVTAALASMSKAFEEYRERVKTEVGEPRERELFNNLEVVDVKGVSTVRKVSDTNTLGPFVRCFDETSRCWEKDPEFNMVFLRNMQSYMNDRLQARGHLFLNTVLEELGFEETRAGAVCGWVVNGDGDGYVDFRMFEPENSRAINNLERCIWLDFNVDGNIVGRIP